MLRVLVTMIAAAALAAGYAGARKFYDDDPLLEVPQPRNAQAPKLRKLSDYYDFFENLFRPAGERQPKSVTIPAQAVNSLGEPMNSEWYTRRHYWNPMTTEQLVAGPGSQNPPSKDGPWTIVAAKSEGITPGFTIQDSRGQRYLMKFDPLEHPELATAADVLVSRFFHAAGYFVPQNYIVAFSIDQLRLGDDVELRDALGQKRKMTRRDVVELLMRVPRDSDGRYRGVASLFLKGRPKGPFRYYGTRADDPNDVVLHEHRRDLRGLGVFCSWFNHDDSRSINTLDLLSEYRGVNVIIHHLIDFGSTLGSASNGPNSPRNGYEYLFSVSPSLKQFFTLGLWVPDWARAKYPGIPSVGVFESKVFDPVKWVPEYPNPAFSNRLPDDSFWAAKQVMAFTDDQVRAIVKTGEYSDPSAEKYVADALIERRDKIGRAFFKQVLPLDRFEVEGGKLVFEDLEIKHRFLDSREYRVAWSHFENETGRMTPIAGATSFAVPGAAAPGGYVAADIQSADPKKRVVVYLRNHGGAMKVVGIDRTW